MEAAGILRKVSRPIADILVGEHPNQLLFLRIVEAASVNPLPGVLVGPEQHVPPGDVPVVVLVAVVLVMDAMHLGALEEEPDPARRPDIGVIEELAQRSAQRVDRTCLKRQAEEGVDKQTADDRVDDHFARVLVEGGNDFKPLRAVVDLVEAAPQKVVFMAPAVPPIEDKRGDEVGDQAADCRRYVRREMNTDAEDSQRSQLTPASRMTPSWTPLISSTRRGQVRTSGNGQPGTMRSRTKQKANAAMMVVSTVDYSDWLHAGLQDLTPEPRRDFTGWRWSE